MVSHHNKQNHSYHFYLWAVYFDPVRMRSTANEYIHVKNLNPQKLFCAKAKNDSILVNSTFFAYFRIALHFFDN